MAKPAGREQRRVALHITLVDSRFGTDQELDHRGPIFVARRVQGRAAVPLIWKVGHRSCREKQPGTLHVPKQAARVKGTATILIELVHGGSLLQEQRHVG